MRISDWSSDVCSSDLRGDRRGRRCRGQRGDRQQRRKGRGRWGRRGGGGGQIGRASCRGRVCQYVSISVVAVSLKKKEYKQQITQSTTSRNGDRACNYTDSGCISTE